MSTTAQFSNLDELPRGLRFIDPTADVVWAAIQTLDEAAKHEVLAHLRAHLAVPDGRQTDQQARVAKAVAALREAAELLGTRGEKRELSPGRYELLRAELDRKGDWPPESSIRRFMGGTWNDALRRAHLDPVTDGDASRTQLGGRLTQQEMITAVQQCSRELDDPLPTFNSYVNWSRRPDVRRRPGRRPSSQGPFDRAFTGWAQVLIAAGLATEQSGDGQMLRASDHSVRSQSGFRWTDEQLIEAMQTIAARLGRSPNSREYPRERELLLAEREQAGDLARAFPSGPVLVKRYRFWDTALVAAGLEPLKNGVTGKNRSQSRRRIGEQVMVDCLREAFATVGHPFTADAYRRWRQEQIATDRQQGVIRRIPSYHTIYAHYGVWATACQRALGHPRA